MKLENWVLRIALRFTQPKNPNCNGEIAIFVIDIAQI